MTSETYEVVKFAAKRTLKCRVCRKPFKRSRTFEHTINPFNRNGDGVMKSYAEVWVDVKAEADAWQPDDLCTKCAEVSE
jgi:hypothetical protein